MYRYKKIMVHLNLDDQDESLIRHAEFIAGMAASEEIVYVHVLDSFSIPEEIRRIYPELASPLDAAAEKRMKEMTGQMINKETRVTFKALEGPVLGVLVSCSKQYDIDLLIVGHNPAEPSSSADLAEKLVRKAFCSVLMIPADQQMTLQKILVPLDFSDYSLNAVDVGSAFAKAAGLTEVSLLNVYKVPAGYYKTGKSYEEFEAVMLENAKSRLRTFIAKADLKSLGISPYFLKANNIVKGIEQFADRLGADLVVVGARGRSGDIAAILLGGITEGLIRTLKKPLLAVKRKGEGLNILDALTSD